MTSRTHIGDERDAQTEENGAECDGEQSPVFEELVRPVVHNAGDESLDVTELAVDTDHHEHEEEDDGPDAPARHLEDNLGVGDEDEAGTTADDLLHLHALVVRHMAKDTEGHHPSKETSS